MAATSRDLASPRRLALFALLLSMGPAACDEGPPTRPASTAAPIPLRLELTAPASIPPGESVQLIARIVKSDNSVEDVTGRAQWASSNPGVLEIAPSGLARGTALGEAFIRVVYQLREVSTRTFVLPTGTYRLTGGVSDNGIGLEGVAVSIVEGTGNGLKTTTGANGQYVVYGVQGRVRLRAQRSGYLDADAERDVQSHASLNVVMRPDRDRTDLRGNYRLTIDRAGCSGTAIPERRSYDAAVEQDGPRLTVKLSGTDFLLTFGFGNQFSGNVFYEEGRDRVTFHLDDPASVTGYYYYGHYNVVESLSEMLHPATDHVAHGLAISGKVTATASGTGISGTLHGTLHLIKGTSAPFLNVEQTCAGEHRFEMARR